MVCDKIKFKCSKCGVESWMQVNLETYTVSINDLVCDDCNPVEEDEEVKAVAKTIMKGIEEYEIRLREGT